MNEKKDDRITRLFREGNGIDQAIIKGVYEAIQRHKKLGYPIVVWKDGKVTWIEPEEIQEVLSQKPA